MSDRLVFVLHAADDADYATRIAASLSPMNAFPMMLGQDGAPQARIGSGGVSVLVWSDAFARTPVGQASALVADRFGADLLICKLLPGDLGVDTQVVAASGNVATDGLVIASALALLEQVRDEQVGAQKSAPRLGVTPTTPTASRAHLAGRSVFGLAATLSIAGALAPGIVERAQAVAAPSTPSVDGIEMQVDASVAQSTALTAAAPMVADSATPALDEWLSEAPEFAPGNAASTDSGYNLATVAVPREPLLLTHSNEGHNAVLRDALLSIDPKRASFEAQRQSLPVKAEQASAEDFAFDLSAEGQVRAGGLGRF